MSPNKHYDYRLTPVGLLVPPLRFFPSQRYDRAIWLSWVTSVSRRAISRTRFGTNRVHDDMLCWDIPHFDSERCRTVVERGDLLFLFTQTGEPAGRIHVTKGNPDLY